MAWEARAREKLDAINSSIPQNWRLNSPVPSAEEQRDLTGPYICQYLSSEEVEITECHAVYIVKNISCGRWRAEDVARAFCHRAALAHQMVSCLHEIFFDTAIKDAIALDEYFAKTGHPVGPLHGLPVSLKDQFHVKGVDTTMGYVGWIGTFQGKKDTAKHKTYESEMVRELRALGAVLYCKTSVPQTLMSAETMNNIIGYTWNPKNRNLSSGGSSGGEGALISLKGSPIGFGTDYSGSIRMPSAFNGLYGIRPSSGRLPYQGLANSMDGQNTVLSVVGPMSHSPASLRLMIKAILSQKPWLYDPLVVELPWRSDQEGETLRYIAGRTTETKLAFGIMRCDGIVQSHPPIMRALDIVTKVLTAAGHELVDWNPPSHQRAIDIVQACWVYDGGEDVHGSFELSGEPMSDKISWIFGSERREEMKASAIAKNNVAKRAFQKEYMDYWNSTRQRTRSGRPVDAFILPAGAATATRPGARTYAGYTTALSALDYSIVTLPVTTVDKKIDISEGFQPISDHDANVHSGYEPEIYHGGHVGLQLVARRFQEEKVLVIAEYLTDLISAQHSASQSAEA
ncbi:hypothetical protein A1O3_10124 [Capronia epimyces CBS 606.96]|uniref:Amidase domain-containing protein n=1 Tax=Capronia epimyces CBS 606.96 TaxID=1182542 RepID=W9X927_9EURO|nr:uncharacterized protein A1O3_10124 [Capronia epimyces CBS 606.96]EXJ76967.1 hypothetical protein A1O3_10124 [Capronia epimyces CBS 606.96]